MPLPSSQQPLAQSLARLHGEQMGRSVPVVPVVPVVPEVLEPVVVGTMQVQLLASSHDSPCAVHGSQLHPVDEPLLEVVDVVLPVVPDDAPVDAVLEVGSVSQAWVVDEQVLLEGSQQPITRGWQLAAGMQPRRQAPVVSQYQPGALPFAAEHAASLEQVEGPARQ
jgi:hypothetical protein